MPVRRYMVSDAPALAALYLDSVRGVGPRDYSPQQVEAWASLTPSVEQLRQRCANGRAVVVAVNVQDRPVAFGDLKKDGHIGYFYCTPDAVGTGVALALYDVLERIATEAGLPRVYVEASEAARRFFLRRGFDVAERRNLMIGEVPIHNFAMEKRLAG